MQNLLLFVRIAIVQIRRYSICPEFVVYAEKAELAATQSATATERPDAVGLPTSKKSKSIHRPAELKILTFAHVVFVPAKLTVRNLF